MVIGVISDTHGLLRPEAAAALRGADQIIHAGDIGGPEVLSSLAEIAPVTAVRGNNDKGAWAGLIPSTALLEAQGVSIYILHDVNELDLDPATAGFQAVICGHSHEPKIETTGNVLYFNPGSAGPRRFRLPITVGRLTVVEDRLQAQLIALSSEP